MMVPDARSTPDSPEQQLKQVTSTPQWLNGALTGLVLSSAVVAALDHHGLTPNPVDDIAWILITLASTGLVRSYASFVAGRGQGDSTPHPALRILSHEWSLIVAGLPAVIILLAAVAASHPMLGAIRTVLGTNVAILLGLGIFGASKAGYRPFQAAALGVADAALGLLVILANALLR
jgi:hypothetical protein